jgi:hypothetical protein
MPVYFLKEKQGYTVRKSGKEMDIVYIDKLLPMHGLGTRGGEWSAQTTAALYFRGKDPGYPLDRRLCGPQSRSGHRG